MSEQQEQRLVQREATLRGHRLFRNNTGKAWVGKVVKRTKELITLQHYRRFHGGLCVGSPDLVGWTVVTITPDMVGRRIGVFTGVEMKGKRGKARPEQEKFIEIASSFGCFCGVCRSIEDYAELIEDGEARI